MHMQFAPHTVLQLLWNGQRETYNLSRTIKEPKNIKKGQKRVWLIIQKHFCIIIKSRMYNSAAAEEETRQQPRSTLTGNLMMAVKKSAFFQETKPKEQRKHSFKLIFVKRRIIMAISKNCRFCKPDRNLEKVKQSSYPHETELKLNYLQCLFVRNQ